MSNSSFTLRQPCLGPSSLSPVWLVKIQDTCLPSPARWSCQQDFQVVTRVLAVLGEFVIWWTLAGSEGNSSDDALLVTVQLIVGIQNLGIVYLPDSSHVHNKCRTLIIIYWSWWIRMFAVTQQTLMESFQFYILSWGMLEPYAWGLALWKEFLFFCKTLQPCDKPALMNAHKLFVWVVLSQTQIGAECWTDMASLLFLPRLLSNRFPLSQGFQVLFLFWQYSCLYTSTQKSLAEFIMLFGIHNEI